MTYVYEWYSIPHTVDITCPSCSGYAKFEFAEVVKIGKKSDLPYFRNSSVFEYRQFKDYNGIKWHGAIWFRGIGASNLGTITDLPDGYSPDDWSHSKYFRSLGSWNFGTVYCKKCGGFSKHMLKWPKDAYWKIAYKSHSLWSFNRQSTVDIINFIESKQRKESDYKWGYMLRHIPKEFLLGKGRETITKRLRKLLEENK